MVEISHFAVENFRKRRGAPVLHPQVEVEAKSDAQEEVREHGSATGVALQRATWIHLDLDILVT